jgi:hypothetical protein
VIDQTATDYDTPATYLPKLVDWADQAEARLTRLACDQVALGFESNAEAYQAIAQEYREIAVRVRAMLTADDAPPSATLALTDWLRTRLGRDFPNMPAELWQALATVLRPFRRQP